MPRTVDTINDTLLARGLYPHLEAQAARDAYGRGYILLVEHATGQVDVYSPQRAVLRILDQATTALTAADVRHALAPYVQQGIPTRAFARGQYKLDRAYGLHRDQGRETHR